MAKIGPKEAQRRAFRERGVKLAPFLTGDGEPAKIVTHSEVDAALREAGLIVNYDIMSGGKVIETRAKFDRNAYQREYMRKRRAEAKASKP